MSKETWEEEFDKIYVMPTDFIGTEKESILDMDKRKVELKAFISKVREKAVLEERRRVSDAVKKLIKEVDEDGIDPFDYGAGGKVDAYEEVLLILSDDSK